MARPRLAVDEHGVVHVNTLRYAAWALCEQHMEESSRLVSEASAHRTAPTCLWCVVRLQRGSR